MAGSSSSTNNPSSSSTNNPSSSSTNNLSEKNDVFLSFRGEDTRNGFVSHLYAALRRREIKTFIDDQIDKGDQISSFLLNTIEASKISVIIFSEKYASSRWCLQELEQILYCKKIKEQIVIPIFYHVDPSDVRNQTGIFGDGLAELEKRKKVKLETLQRWKTALNEAANLGGHTINYQKPESKLLEETADDILEKLYKFSPRIWGIGGAGKTTIARVVFNKILNRFEGSYFAENVREESEKSGRLTHLQEKLLSKILKDKDPNLGLTFTRDRLKKKKVLIVFDDVTSLQQIENLIGNLNLLSSKSQIIITTRDKQVLRTCGVDDAYIYKVEGLSEMPAHRLFNQYAFKQRFPTKDYIELSNQVVEYSQGISLALKVLGSYLCSREKEFWESAIKNLEKCPLLDIQKVLRVSYDGLEKEEKVLFLDIACFFKGENRDSVIETLNACDISAKQGIQVLIDKCLVFVAYKNEITMHDLLQEMGREIARDDTCKHIRLWHHMDIIKAFKRKKGRDAVRSINLDISKISNAGLNFHVLSEMDDLRFFRVYNSYHLNSSDCYENKLHGFEELESFPSDIIFFSWNNYPFKSVPLSFPPESLVRLDMPKSKVKHWNGVQDLVNLKYVDLRYSEHMTEIPNLSRASNLKELILKGCSGLLKIAPSSIQNLNELAKLDLSGCKRLISLPDAICKLKSLEHLYLNKCSKLERLPDDFGDLKALTFFEASKTALKEAPSSILLLPKLLGLAISHYCEDQTPLNWVLNSSSGSGSLSDLWLYNCQITKLPDNLRQLSDLLQLDLSGNNFESIPNIGGLSYLLDLDISNCRRLQLLPELPMGVSVCASNCLSLQSISDPSFLLLPLWRQRASIFVNCFELDLPKILHEESCREFCADIIFPGNEIPKWFTFQNTGSYIALDQPLDWHNKNFLGFLASVVLPPSSYQFPYNAAICYCLDKGEDGKQQIYTSKIQSDDEAYGRHRSEDAWSDHVVLSFHSINKMTFKKCKGECHEIYSEMKSLNCKVLIKFIARHKGVKKCRIQKCGIHFLYVGAYGEPSETSRRSVDNAKKKGKEKDELQSNKLQISNPFDGICSLRPHFMSKSPYDNPNIFKSCLEERYWKLKRNALRETVKNALLSFQQSTTLCSEIEEMNCVNPKGCMSFPGSEIPEWFSFQNASYNIKLSSGSFHDAIDTCHNPFAGLAFCTVVEFPDLLDLGQPFFVYCMMDIKYLNDPYETFAIGSIKGWFEGDRTHYIKSDHVFLGYDCVMYSGETRTLFNREVEINFVVTTYDMVPIEGCKVKKCGVHLLCPEDYKWKDLIDLSSLKRKLKLNGNGRYNDEPPSDDFSAACNCQFKSSATSLDLNEMLDTTEPLSKRLKVCNYKNKEIEAPELNPSTSQPTGFADFDLNEFPIDDEDEPQPKRLKEFKFF